MEPSPASASSHSTLAPTAPSKREERQVRDAELVDRYGEARTNLSRHVVGNVVSLLEDAVEMGDLMLNGENRERFGGGRQRWVMDRVLRDTDIELGDDQRESADALVEEFQRRELERTREAVGSLKENPSTLMNLMLASDARSRGELSEAEYAALQEASAGELGNLANPLDRNSFRGRDPLEDEAFRQGFEALLEPGQAASFQTAMEERSADGESGAARPDITQIPVMDLESLDEAVGSARKMASGFKQVMQGMGGLGPLLEQQRRNQQGGGE